MYALDVDFTLLLFTFCLCLSQDWKVLQVNIRAAFLISDADQDSNVYHPYNEFEELMNVTIYKLFK